MASEIQVGEKTTIITETITGASLTDPVTITVATTGLVNGASIYITDVVGQVELNDDRYEVTNKQTNSVDLLGVDGTGHTAYVSGGVVGNIRLPLGTTQPQTVNEIVDLWTALDNMARGDNVYFWLREQISSGQADVWAMIGLFNHEQGDRTAFISEPYNMQNDWDWLIEQWGGVARPFRWSIRQP